MSYFDCTPFHWQVRRSREVRGVSCQTHPLAEASKPGTRAIMDTPQKPGLGDTVWENVRGKCNVMKILDSPSDDSQHFKLKVKNASTRDETWVDSRGFGSSWGKGWPPQLGDVAKSSSSHRHHHYNHRHQHCNHRHHLRLDRHRQLGRHYHHFPQILWGRAIGRC